jgi:hypothetical protein
VWKERAMKIRAGGIPSPLIPGFFVTDGHPYVLGCHVVSGKLEEVAEMEILGNWTYVVQLGEKKELLAGIVNKKREEEGRENIALFLAEYNPVLERKLTHEVYFYSYQPVCRDRYNGL